MYNVFLSTFYCGEDEEEKKLLDLFSPHNTITIVSPTKIFQFRSMQPAWKKKQICRGWQKRLARNNNNIKNDEWNEMKRNEKKEWNNNQNKSRRWWSFSTTYTFCDRVSHSFLFQRVPISAIVFRVSFFVVVVQVRALYRWALVYWSSLMFFRLLLLLVVVAMMVVSWLLHTFFSVLLHLCVINCIRITEGYKIVARMPRTVCSKSRQKKKCAHTHTYRNQPKKMK